MIKRELGSVCSRLSSGKSIRAENINPIGAYPVIGGNGLRGYTDSYNFDGECAVIGRQGAACGNVRYHSGKAYMTEHAVVVCANDENDTRYLSYLLSIQNLGRLSAQSAQPGISVKTLSKQEVCLPPLDKQKRVSQLLGTIDSKINANTKLNDYLAELGDALFNRECPQSNEPNAILSDIAQVTMGQSPSGSSYNEDGNGEVFYQGRAEFGAFFPRRRLFTTEPKRMAREGDTLMSVRAPVGDLNIANEDCCIGRGLAAIHSENNQSFVHYLVRAQGRQLDTFNGDGTVFGSINGKALKKLPVYLPSSDVIARLESRLEPIDALIRRNDDEMQALERMRDTLLPRLMSGEIDVSKVDLTQPNNHLPEHRPATSELFPPSQ